PEFSARAFSFVSLVLCLELVAPAMFTEQAAKTAKEHAAARTSLKLPIALCRRNGQAPQIEEPRDAAAAHSDTIRGAFGDSGVPIARERKASLNVRGDSRNSAVIANRRHYRIWKRRAQNFSGELKAERQHSFSANRTGRVGNPIPIERIPL